MSEGKIRVTQEALQLAADLLCTTLQDQILAGLDMHGHHFPPGVTLLKSGTFLRSFRGVVQGDKAYVEVRVPYATILNQRYGFESVCPQWLPDFNKKLQVILAKGVVLDPA